MASLLALPSNLPTDLLADGLLANSLPDQSSIYILFYTSPEFTG